METASFVISLFALGISALALPTLFQMYWGGPSVKMETNESHVENWRLLRIYIYQPRIKNKFMRKVGVLRQPTDVQVRYEVFENPTGKLVLPAQFPKLKTDREHAPLVTLSGFFPAIIAIAGANGVGAYLFTGDDMSGNIPLATGRYKISITAIYAMHKEERKSFLFTVNHDSTYLVWD